MLVIFLSLREAPLPDHTQTPPNTPKRTRNRAETDPKKDPKRTRNGSEMDRNQALWGGTAGGGVCRDGGVVRVVSNVREKENH